jgi:polyhydroxyalkanoate synthesis regulator protein
MGEVTQILLTLSKKDDMGLLRTLLIILIIYYLGRLIMRYVLPALFYNYMDDKVKEFSQQQQKQRRKEQQQTRKREGEVNIDYTPQGSGKNRPSKGEYVDYEEVRD